MNPETDIQLAGELMERISLRRSREWSWDSYPIDVEKKVAQRVEYHRSKKGRR